MREPGPDHPISIVPAGAKVSVHFGGMLIAQSERALRLQETTMAPVLYVPREDVRMDFLSRTEESSHCPYKGDASYYSITVAGLVAENAVWSYEKPFPAMAEISGHLAFYPNRVDAIEES